MTQDNSLMSQFGGKIGTVKKKKIRYNVLGRAVKRTTRSVISNNPFLNINEIMVDRKVAKEIRIKDIITSFNIDHVRQIIREQSDDEDQTITRIIRGNGSFMVTKNTQVYNGDMFERDLQDGDYVSYNRSPSLLPTYMAGFKVKITEESVDTIQMNILTCNLVNADFDGDAMCMFYPNNSSSRAELKYLNGIQQMVVNIQNSKLNVKIAEECVVGLFKLSISTIYKQELKYLTENLDKYTTDKMYAELPEVFSGLDVISKLLPKNLNYCGKTNFYSENIHQLILKQIDDPKTDKIVKSYLQEAYKDYGGKHKSLVIENGIIKSGVIDTSINAILEYILVTDRVCVMDLMRNLQIISLNFIQYNTISIGLDDLCQPYQKDLCD